MNKNKLIEIIDSNGRFNLPTAELEELADHLIANDIGCVAEIKAENKELKKELEKAETALFLIIHNNIADKTEGDVELVAVKTMQKIKEMIEFDTAIPRYEQARARLNKLKGETK